MSDRDPINGQEVSTEAEMFVATSRWVALRTAFPGKTDRELTQWLRTAEGHAWIEQRIRFELSASMADEVKQVVSLRVSQEIEKAKAAAREVWDAEAQAKAEAAAKSAAEEAREEEESFEEVKIDRSEAQLTRQEELEIVDACGEVRDAVRKMHPDSIALMRHIDRGNAQLRREKMEEYARAMSIQFNKMMKALKRIPYLVAPALIAVACLMLAGCGGDYQGRSGGDSAAASGTHLSCPGGQCPAAK